MPVPAVYLFYGDNRFAISQALDSLRLKLGSAASLDLMRFSASKLDLAALQQACSSAPFMADRRLVIVEGAESLPKTERFQEELVTVLDRVPASTALVFAAQVDLDRRSLETFQKRSALYRWATDNPQQAFVRQFASPRGAAFAAWLTERAEELGGQLEPQAAELLTESIDEDELLGEQELQKLIDYTTPDRPISAEDVERLTPIYGQTDIFEAIDGLGTGAGSFGKLQRLLEEQDPSYVFLMVVRQFRLLLQARYALEQGRDPTSVLKVPAFVSRKVAAQAAKFSLPVLESMYQQLQDFDLRIKRGDADPSIDLIPLLAEHLALRIPQKTSSID